MSAYYVVLLSQPPHLILGSANFQPITSSISYWGSEEGYTFWLHIHPGEVQKTTPQYILYDIVTMT